MIADGLPAAAIIPPEERREAWKGRKLTKVRDVKAPSKSEDPATKAIRKEAARAEEAKKAARLARLNELKEQTMKAKTTKTTARKAKKTAPKARAASTSAPTSAKGVRPGSKLEIVAGLLTRKEGCTTADALAATDWPAISFNQQAKAAGLTLRKEKDGKTTRYFGTAA